MTLQMAELEIDDVAFLTGESVGHQKATNCHDAICGSRRTSRFGKPRPARIISCSLTQLFVSGSVSIGIIIMVILILSLAKPFHNSCSLSLNSINRTTSHLGKSTDSLTSSQSIATNGEPFPWMDIRLPAFIVPIRYDLFMHPNLTTFTNKGNVDILLRVKQKRDFLVVHIRKFNITEILMTNDKGSNIVVRKHLICESQEQLFIQFDRYLSTKNNYTLKISFNKQLAEELEGFYVSSYIDMSTARKHYLATTHFEPTSARSAFPCFDEPALKASFSLNMVHEIQYEVYFNSERREKLAFDVSRNLMVSIFDQTVTMSTYLVAFVVCDFKSLSARTRDGIHVRSLVPNDQYTQAEFSLATATSILSYFQEFFNVTYPLSKLDLVAVPDFGAGAMENWGLITFRTTMILYNPEESSSEAKEQVATVISHELAHQWFGNLVTMQWWNDLWLNEGFASFVENLGVNYIHPEWHMLDQFVVSTTQHALSLDALESSHPIMANVKNPSEIEAIFDVISYKKGASLIYMLQNFLNMDILRLGLSHYLNKYQFRNAETQDLWNSFNEVLPPNSPNVSAIMDTWIKQKGFPVVNVRWAGYKIFLTQSRFLSSPPTDDTAKPEDISPFGYKWIIPITVRTSRNPPNKSSLYWFNGADMSITFDVLPRWYKLNVNQTGFYRVNYDRQSWKSLIDLMWKRDYNQHVLSPTDRANLLDDAFALMQVGKVDVDLAMNLTRYLENGERDYVPWQTALLQFEIMDTLMMQNPLLQKYICKLVQPLVTIWGWRDEDAHLMRKLRSQLLNAAVTYQDTQSIQIARRFFDEWMRNGIKIATNLRNVVYKTGVEYGGRKEWQFCWDKYRLSTIPSEQRLLLEALGATKNAWLLSQYLNYSLDRSKIKPQDTVHVLSVVSRNPVGRLLAWRFVREHWSQIISVFGQGSFSMDTIISETTSHFTTQFDYDEVKNFFNKVDVGSGLQALHQSLERIKSNIFWKTYIESKVINWLKRYGSISNY